MERDAQTWTDLAEALAFLGNSLLAPMNQTGTVGLEPAFWASFPRFDDERVAEALGTCECYAQRAQEVAEDGGNPVQDVSVEFTHLFVGPPSPAAAPWETMYRPGSEGATVGFGQATFEMRALLREAGLQVSNENNQYADHMGIELLFASTLCSRVAACDDEGEAQSALDRLERFLDDHPRAWVGKLAAAVSQARPEGYISALLGVVEALLAIA